ncbi:MAG: SUMF1/EgtB/PvdO family nonheme iron enzyme [Terrimicrobiaceae bacterium]
MASRLEQILAHLGLSGLHPFFRKEKVDDSLLGGLTDSDLREIGVVKLGDRKRLLAAFSNAATPLAAPEFSPAPEPAPQPAPTAPRAAKEAKEEGGVADHPSRAALGHPFLNSLGMPFVPTTRSKTLFCIWQLRICDYAQYCSETGAAMPSADYPQGADHPVVNVSWADAHLFCEWLTKREIWLGLINSHYQYRFPKDEEWSAAVGLPYEHGINPRARSGVIEEFPWGPDFPPPHGAGNYHARLAVDEFKETSPVGSFAPNKFGIYDLGGNVWEWCVDEYERGSSFRVLRGASCFNDDPEFLRSSYRDKFQPDKGRNNAGIRIVLAPQSVGDPWYKA